MIVSFILTIVFLGWIIGCGVVAYKALEPIDASDCFIVILLTGSNMVLSGVGLWFVGLALYAIWSL